MHSCLTQVLMKTQPVFRKYMFKRRWTVDFCVQELTSCWPSTSLTCLSEIRSLSLRRDLTWTMKMTPIISRWKRCRKMHFSPVQPGAHSAVVLCLQNLQSTNWQTMRFKPPPPNSDIGWRVEFRPMEVTTTTSSELFNLFISNTSCTWTPLSGAADWLWKRCLCGLCGAAHQSDLIL